MPFYRNRDFHSLNLPSSALRIATATAAVYEAEVFSGVNDGGIFRLLALIYVTSQELAIGNVENL